jgi:hypothetical protein
MRRAAALAALLPVALLLLAACGGEEQRPAPRLVAATASRDIVDGAAQLTSTIELRFSSEFKLASDRLPLSSYFEIDVPDPAGPEGTTRRVLVQRATLAEGPRPRTVTLHVGTLVPDGSTVRVAERAFNTRATGELSLEVDSDLDPLQALLASTPVGLLDISLIESGDPPPVTAADRDPEVQRAALAAHLEARGSPAEVSARALAVFDAIPEAIVPSPKLRAAFAGLVGTFAEGAIANLLTADNCTGQPAAAVVFQPPPDLPTLLARVTFAADGRRIVSLNPITEGERFEYLMPVLAHEAVHCDREAGIFEEVAATAFDSLLYMLLVAAVPDLAEGGSPLRRDLNADAIALINSGRAVPESIGVLPSVGVQQVFPGSTSRVRSFAELIARAYEYVDEDESPPEPLALQYAAILAQAAGMQAGDPFNLVYLDELLGRALHPATLLAAMDALSLVPVR